MPESYDKHGHPKLYISVQCRTMGCGHVDMLDGQRADNVASKLARGLTVQDLLYKMRCQRCGHALPLVQFFFMKGGNPETIGRSLAMQDATGKRPPRYEK